MKRSMEVIVAGVLLFVGGSLAGRFIHPGPAIRSADDAARPLPPLQFRSDSVSDDDGRVAEIREISRFSDWLAVEESLDNLPGTASFPEPAAPFRTAAFQASESSDEVGRDFVGAELSETRQAIRQLIDKHFPDADADNIEIWCHQYADLPLSDVDFLLQQQQQFTALLPASLAGHVITPAETSDRSSTASLGERQRQIAEHNFRNRTTPGFRCRTLLTLPDSLRPEDVSGVKDVCREMINFSAGQLWHTGNPRHLAIDGHPDLMFRLEPGDVLTRCGVFEQLDDGRLGFHASKGPLALAGCPAIPCDAATIQIDRHGRMTSVGGDGVQTFIGQLHVAQVPDLSKLDSDDGVVFFSTQTGDSLPMVTPEGMLRAAHLETSNFDVPPVLEPQ